MRKIHFCFLSILCLIIILSIFISYTLLEFIKSDTMVISSQFNVTAGGIAIFELPEVNENDRVYFVFNTSSRIKVEQNSMLIQLPYDIESRPFEFEDWIICQQRLCFIVNSSSNSAIRFKFLDPENPYYIKFPGEKLNYTLFNLNRTYDNYLGIHIETITTRTYMAPALWLIYPYHKNAEPNFQVNGSLRLMKGDISYIHFILVTGDKNFFAYNLISNKNKKMGETINFYVNAHNKTINGQTFSERFEKQLSYLMLAIGLNATKLNNETISAEVAIGTIQIKNGNSITKIIPKVSDAYQVSYSLYIFHKFHATPIYEISVLTLIFLVIAAGIMLARITGFKIELRTILKPLVTTEAISDPRPKTYLARLFHKPRYDQLVELLLQFVGRKISVLIDVGCGRGALYEFLKKNGINTEFYIGCDIDKETLKEAGNIERVLCDVQHLPFKKNAGEVIICSEVLEHTANPNLGFSELLNASQRWIFITFPEERLKNALGFRYFEHISEPNAKEFKNLAEKKEFRLIKINKKYFIFPPSVFDKLGLSYTAFYRLPVELFFQGFSEIFRPFAMMKTVILVFLKNGKKC